MSFYKQMFKLCDFLVTKVCRFLKLWMEVTASRYGGKLRIYWIISHRQQTSDGPPAWEVGGGLTTSHRTRPAYYEMLHKASVLAVFCEHGNEHSDSVKGGEFFD
jgi:hypothetical protein